VYLADLFRRLGVADQIKSKLTQTPTGVVVGSILAKGEVEIGFQQISELAHYPGIDYVGPLPADVQTVTVFSSGMQVGAKAVDAARAWVAFLTSPAAATVFTSKSLEPAARAKP
jgi:molybdate transport system substrate-binding protein